MEIGKDLGGTSRVVGGTDTAWGSRWDRFCFNNQTFGIKSEAF